MTTLELIAETIKETAIEMIKGGVPSIEVAKQIAVKFDNATARIIMVEIANDLGLINESKNYLAQF